MKVAIALIPSLALLSIFEAKPARADLTYNIYELMGNVVVEATGSLSLPPSSLLGNCGIPHGYLNPSLGIICNGSSAPSTATFSYSITGPTSFDGGPAAEASSSSGVFTSLFAIESIVAIDVSYISDTPILGSSTFAGKTLADFGLTPNPSAGMWTLSNGEKINVKVTPGPLPVFGTAAAYSFSRRLRRRIQTNEVNS